MTTQTIKFNHKNKTYTFSRKVTTPTTGTFEFIKECCAKAGADPKRITHRMMTHSDWHFWCGFTM